MKLFGDIKISPYGRQWQASVPVVDMRIAHMPGVSGTQHQDGPWIGALGATPEAALSQLIARIGAAVLALALAEETP